MVFVHGGGWYTGNKYQNLHCMVDIVVRRHKLALVAVDYRLTQHGRCSVRVCLCVCAFERRVREWKMLCDGTAGWNGFDALEDILDSLRCK